MHRTRVAASLASVVALCAAATACGGGSATGNKASNDNPKELTYWASNQAPDVQADKKVLGPELKKFQQQTGIKVKLEVIPWSDLLNRIMTAVTSGQGPDVLNIGNTWSASLQATGALLPFDHATMQKVGGADRFEPSALAATGAKGKSPAAVPLYSLAYGLYYNKAMFKDAGIDGPPKTWSQLVADGKKLTKGGKYGLAVEGGNPEENAHHAFILGKQHGANFFDGNKPTFDTPQTVAAVKQYIDFLGKDKIVAPGNAEYAANQSIRDFATGKAAMLMWQNAKNPINSHGMKSSQYGVAPLPVQSTSDTGQRSVQSMVAGINMAVFKNTDNHDGALKFVKFMTSDTEQKKLNGEYGSLPPIRSAQKDKAFDTADLGVLRHVLTTSAAPLPQVPNESQFETLVGTAMKNLLADAAAGRPVTTASVKKELDKAQQQMPK